MFVSKRSFLAAALLPLALSLGCALPGHVRAVKTADRLSDLKASLGELQVQVTATSGALSALIARKDQDVDTAYGQLESDVHALEVAQRHVDSCLEDVQHEAEAYFFHWKEQAATIEDEDLKEHSEERRNELASAVGDVTEALKPVHESVETYLNSFHDTLKYLSIDLAPSSVASIEGRSKDANKASKSIASKVNDALEKVHAAEPLFASARASAPKKAADFGPDTNN